MELHRSNVDLQSAHGRKGIAHAFPHCGMRMHHVHHIVYSAFQMQHCGSFRQNFRGQRSDDVNSQHLAVFFIRDHFDEAAVIPKNGGLAVSHEGKFPGLHRITRVARLLFRQTDGTNLRLAIRGIGNAQSY